MDRFDSLQAFVRVVETGSFAEAPRQLGLSTSAVSKRVSYLEETLSVQLLHRTTRNVNVTDLGSVFYERATEIIALMSEAEWLMQQGRRAPVGHLRISSPTSFGMMHVAPALCEFHKLYPSIKIEIILNDRVINPVEEGFDVCLQDVGPRLGSMIERRLFPLQRIVCASPQYAAAHGLPRHPHELAEHACIHYSYLESGNAWRFEGPEGPVEVAIDPIFSTNNGRIMLETAVEGTCIAVLPTFLALPELQRGALEVIFSAYTVAPIYLSAVYPRRKHLASKVKLLLDFFSERFGPEPPWDRELARLLAAKGVDMSRDS
ncbi:MAG: hypothetical protein ETSY1_13130 [Candidatus Entotheonella factor]|uniref:HTH lysR-type domain-containing protein n=1 Tax=Entotheonella factor TaxID=1429438 RepID=W4LPZ1_ENTF1|nr:MAG: hypothetical protein ETSY1_13130 [Candidatus Entotheonella factor]